MKRIDYKIVELVAVQNISLKLIAQKLEVSEQTIRNRIKSINNECHYLEIEKGIVKKTNNKCFTGPPFDEENFLRFLILIDRVDINKIAAYLYKSEKTVYSKIKSSRTKLESFSNLVQVHQFIEENYHLIVEYDKLGLSACHKRAQQYFDFDYSFIECPVEEIVGNLKNIEVFHLEEEYEEFITRFIKYLNYCFDSVSFSSKTQQNLDIHLRNAFVAYKFGIDNHDTISLEIISKYDKLFRKFHESIKYFFNIEGLNLKEADYIYLFVILLADLHQNYQPEQNVVIVCENGVALSYLIHQQLQNHFRNFNCIYIGSKKQYLKGKDQLAKDLDILIINSGKPIDGAININGYLTEADLELLSTVLEKNHDLHISDYQLYMRLQGSLVSSLNYNKFKKIIHQTNNEEEMMLAKLVRPNLIQKQKHINSWQEAIRICAQPLLDNGYVTKNYIEAMIDNVKELGTYIILIDNFALPHSKPEDGSLKVGCSFLILEQAVEFPNNQKVNVIMTLSTSKSNEHLQALVDLSHLLSVKDVISYIKNLSTEEEIYDYITNF